MKVRAILKKRRKRTVECPEVSLLGLWNGCGCAGLPLRRTPWGGNGYLCVTPQAIQFPTRLGPRTANVASEKRPPWAS